MNSSQESDVTTPGVYVKVDSGSEGFATGFIGKVIAYTDSPTVLIQAPDGRRLQWRADRCKPASRGDLITLLETSPVYGGDV